MDDILWTWQVSGISGDWLARSNEPMPDSPTMDDIDQRTDYAIAYTPLELIDYKLREYQDMGTRFVMRYYPN